MRILIANTQVPFVHGGAEIHAEALRQALVKAGHEADLVRIPFKWYPPEKIFDHLLACRLLDLTESSGAPVDRLIGLKFPAYHIPHPNKVLWVLHQYRSAFDLWKQPDCDLAVAPNGAAFRDSIDRLERNLLLEARAIYANSGNVAGRLRSFSGCAAQPLYHPPQDAESFHCVESGDYLFFPSRLSKLKRQELVLEALAETRQPVCIRLAGGTEHPDYPNRLQHLSRQLGVDRRVAWLGPIPAVELRAQYAASRAVIYPPLDEDYGYVTLEAMLSSKPVITCRDSGGPLEFIAHESEGLIAEPEPGALAEAMDRAWRETAWAVEAGRRGRERYLALGIDWPNVVKKLTA